MTSLMCIDKADKQPASVEMGNLEIAVLDFKALPKIEVMAAYLRRRTS